MDADEDDVVEVPSSSDLSAAKWALTYDIIGNPMHMVAVPTHFFKVQRQ